MVGQYNAVFCERMGSLHSGVIKTLLILRSPSRIIEITLDNQKWFCLSRISDFVK